MTKLTPDEFSRYHAAIDGIGLLLEESATESPYNLRAPDLLLERSDFAEQLDQNRLDSLYWGSNRSWHHGAGQERLEMPGASSPFRFLDSRGIDITTVGRVTLTKKMSKVFTNAVASPYLTIKGTTNVYVVRSTAAGTGNQQLRKWGALDQSDGSDIDLGITNAIHDLTNDGSSVYVAHAAGGVRKVSNTDVVTSFSATDTRRLLFANDRLFMLGDKSANVPRFGEFALDGTFTEHYEFGAGVGIWNEADLAELDGLIYVMLTQGSTTQIWVWDGTDLKVALPPDGIGRGFLGRTLIPFSGAGLLIGGDDDESNAGMLFRAFPRDAEGHLEAEEVFRTDPDASKNLGINTGFTYGRYAYFSYDPIADDVKGLGVYDPIEGIYASDVSVAYSAGMGQVLGSGIHKGRKLFAVANDGVYVEQTTYRADGYIISSIIDANVSADKIWLVIEAAFASLPATSKVELSYSTDGGTTWTVAGTATATDATRLRKAISSITTQVKAPSVQYRLKLYASTDEASTPTVHTAGIGGWPASKPGAEHVLMVRAYPDSANRSGVTSHDPDAGWNLLSSLLTRRDSQNVLAYQPPWWPITNTVVNARIASVETIGPWGADGPAVGGLIQLTIKEVPS